MKRKILIAIYIILICFSLKCLHNIVTSGKLIEKYNNGESYSESEAKKLTYFNFIQKYIAHYNYANILYQKGKYEDAIEEYKKALNCNVPKNKECSIRINCALAICKTVQLDENSEDSIKKSIKTYESAIDVLTENGCANKNDSNGHSEEAEQLKEDIQKEIDRLKKLQTSEPNDENNEENDEKDKETDRTETIEEKIQKLKEEAVKEQNKKEEYYEDLYNNTKKYNWHKKNW